MAGRQQAQWSCYCYELRLRLVVCVYGEVCRSREGKSSEAFGAIENAYSKVKGRCNCGVGKVERAVVVKKSGGIGGGRTANANADA